MDIMTISQTASYLQVCEKTIRRLIEKKELTASKVGGSWRIKKSDVDDYLENNKIVINNLIMVLRKVGFTHIKERRSWQRK